MKGYGGLFRARSSGTSYLIGAGADDGLPRSLSGKGRVILRRALLPIVGRVSLNHCFALGRRGGEVTERSEFATLIGSEGGSRIRVEDVARAAATSPYEILVRLSPRLERRYYKGGRLVRVRTVRDAYRDVGDRSR